MFVQTGVFPGRYVNLDHLVSIEERSIGKGWFGKTPNGTLIDLGTADINELHIDGHVIPAPPGWVAIECGYFKGEDGVEQEWVTREPVLAFIVFDSSTDAIALCPTLQYTGNFSQGLVSPEGIVFSFERVCETEAEFIEHTKAEVKQSWEDRAKIKAKNEDALAAIGA